MFSEILTRILTKYINKYVYELNPASVRSSLLRGVVELNNLFLRPDALDTLPGIGLKLGYVEQISLRIPWKSFWKESFSIKVSTVYIVVYSYDPELSENTIKQQILSNLKNKLKSLVQIEQRVIEQNKEKIAAEVGNAAGAGTQQMGRMKRWVLWLQNLAINNITLSINDVVILWSSPELMGVSSALCIQSVFVSTVDDSIVDNLDLKEKNCTIDNLSLRYYSVTVDERLSCTNSGIVECEKELGFWRHLFRESSYIPAVDPFRVATTIQLCRNFSHEAKPFVTIQLHVPNVQCCTDLQTILSLVKSLSTSIATGELAFTLTSGEIKYLDRDCLPEGAIKCLGEVLIRSRAIDQIETVISAKNSERSSLLKERLHASFKKHYFSHLRYKYIGPLLSKQSDPPTVGVLTDDYLDTLQDVIGYVGPSAAMLVELTASIPIPIVTQLQQECLSAFFNNLPEHIEQTRYESVEKMVTTSDQLTQTRFSRKDLLEFQKLAGVPSTLDIDALSEESGIGENRLELVRVISCLSGISISICKRASGYPTELSSDVLLKLSLQTINCAFNLFKSSEFAFSCELGAIRGECAAAKGPVLTTLNEAPAFSISTSTPGRLGGSMYIKGLLVPIHLVCVPSMIPFAVSLVTAMNRNFPKSIKVPVQKPSTLNLVTLYNEVDKGITTFLQERAITLELSLELSAPVITISAPTTGSLVCSLGKVSVQSMHFLSEQERSNLTHDSQTLMLFVKLKDMTICMKSGSGNDPIGEDIIVADLEEEPIVKPCSISVYLHIPMTTNPMTTDITQNLLDITFTITTIKTLILLCNRYAYELLHTSICEQHRPSLPMHLGRQTTLVQQTPTIDEKLRQTALLLRNKTAAAIINVTLEGMRLAIGDSNEVEICVGQGQIELQTITSQSKGINAKFRLSVLDFFVCGTPVAYLTGGTVDVEENRIASGSLTIENGVELSLEIGMLHLLIDVVLIIKMVSVLEKILQFYTNAGLMLLWSQLSHKFSSSRSQYQYALQEHSRSSITLLIDFSGLDIHLLSTPYLLSLPSNLDSLFNLALDTTLICTARMNSVYFNITVDSKNVFVNWSFHGCTIEQSEAESINLNLLEFLTPVTSEVCVIGCVHLYDKVSYDPNLLVHAQIISDVIVTISGRSLQYLLHSGNLLLDCLLRFKEALELDIKEHGTKGTTNNSASRLLCSVFVPCLEINAPIRDDCSSPQFSLQIRNLGISTNQAPGASTIRLNGWIDELILKFLDPVAENNCIHHTICTYNGLEIVIGRTYRLHHQEVVDLSDNQQEGVFLTRQIIVIDLLEDISVCLTPKILHAAIELISADRNLGFTILDDTNESKLQSIKQIVDEYTERIHAQNNVNNTKNTTENINRLLSHNFKEYLTSDITSIRVQLKLDDTFIDIVEQEYLKVPIIIDKESSQLSHLNQFCLPVVNNILKISFPALHLQLHDSTRTIAECKLSKSNMMLEKISDVEANGYVGSLTLKATDSPFPLFDVTQVMFQYKYDSVHRQITLLFTQETRFVIILDRIAINIIFSLLSLRYTPSELYILERQAKQELATSINEKIVIIQEKSKSQIDRNSISHDILSALHASQARKTVTADNPMLKVVVSMLVAKFAVVLSSSNTQEINKLEDAEHIILSAAIGVVTNISLRQKYVINTIDYQVQDFFKHSEICIEITMDNCKLVSYLTEWRTGTENVHLSNIIWIPKLLCTFTTVSTDVQASFARNNQQEDIISRKQSSSINIIIEKKSEIIISPILLYIYAIVKEMLFTTIPHEILEEAEQIAREKLEKIKSKSARFLKGTVNPRIKNDNIALYNACSTAILNTTPIMVSGFHFPVYTVSKDIKAEVSSNSQPLLLLFSSPQNTLPLFVVGCCDVQCVYESTLKTAPDTPHQTLLLTTTLYAKSYNEALKLYDSLLCSTPVSFSYKMLSRCPKENTTITTNKTHLELPSIHNIYKTMRAQISILFSVQSDLFVLLTPTSLLALMHFINIFSAPVSNFLKTKDRTEDAELLLNSLSSEGKEVIDESFVSSIPTTSSHPGDSERQQLLEFYPSSIIRLVKVYNGTSESCAHPTSEGTMIFYMSLSKIDNASMWVELISEGIVKTTQLSLYTIIFNEQYEIDQDWVFVFIKQESKIEVHCLSTCILLNYTTCDYSFIAEVPVSSSFSSVSQLYSSTETSSVAASGTLGIRSTFMSTSMDSSTYSINNRTQISGVLRKNSYTSVPKSVTFMQILYGDHPPLELVYYLHISAENPLETFIIENNYDHMRIITFSIHLFGRSIQVLQLAPTYFIANGMPCIAEAKLNTIRTLNNNSGLEIKDSAAVLFPMEFATLNASLRDEIRLMSLSADFSYADKLCRYILKNTYSLPYDEHATSSQSVVLDLISVHQYNAGVYHCNASIKKQTMKKTSGMDTLLFMGLYAPSAIEIKIYASAILQNNTLSGLSFCIFRLDSRYNKRTQITSLVKYKEAAIIWGRYSDSIKLSVSVHPSLFGDNECIEYHKSDVFRISTFSGYSLHCMHSKTGKKQTTIFVCSINKQLKGSPSMVYRLCAAIEMNNWTERPISILIAPLDQKDKTDQKIVCVDPNSTVPVFELPGTKNTLTDYAARFLEDKRSLLKRLKPGYSKELLHVDSLLIVVEVYCTEYKLNITVRLPKSDDAQLHIFSCLTLDLYCSYKHSAHRTKHTITPNGTITLYFLLSDLEFYYKKPSGSFSEIFCVKMTQFCTDIEFREPESKKKCHANFSIKDGAIYCNISYYNDAQLELAMDQCNTKQDMLINANLEIRKIKILLVGPDDSDFSCRREYISFAIAFIDIALLVSTQYYRVSAQIGQIIFENILGLTNQPRILHLKSIKTARALQQKKPKQDHAVVKNLETPAIVLTTALSTNLSILEIECFSIKIGKLNIHIDQSVIDVILRFLRMNTLLSVSFNIESTENQILQADIHQKLFNLTKDDDRYHVLVHKLCNSVFNFTDQVETHKANSKNGILYIRQLDISAITSKATISINNLPFHLNPVVSTLNQIGIVTFSIEDARIRMGAIKLQNRLLTLQELIQHLYRSYIKAISMNAGNLLIATPMLGNLSSLATHFTDSFRAPKNKGVTRIENFVSHNTAGVMSVARALFESSGKMLDAASMDSKHSAQRAILLYESQKSLKAAWKNAGTEFWRELKSAFAGLISKPRKGFTSKGMKGFFRGLGQGLVGSVTKSLGSINDAILHVIVGVNGSALRVCKPVIDQNRSRMFIGPLLEKDIIGYDTLYEAANDVDSESDGRESTQQ